MGRDAFHRVPYFSTERTCVLPFPVRDYPDRLEPEERLHHLQSIQKNSRRMSELMEEVLVLSRFDAGKMDFTPVPLGLSGFFRRLVDEVLSATNRQCPIEFCLGLVSDEGRADEKLLRHIFTNLITNAVKYSEPGHGTTVTVRLAVFGP